MIPETVYGKLDDDPSLLEAVRKYASEQGASSIVIVAFQRVPLGARICKQPGSLTYEFILNDNNRPIAARQLPNGAIQCPFKS